LDSGLSGVVATYACAPHSYVMTNAPHWSKTLAVAVLEKALNDACGTNVLASEHPWSDTPAAKRWLKKQLANVPESHRAARVRELIVQDAKEFLMSPDREADRFRLFALADVRCPAPSEIPRILARWKARRTSAGASSSRAST